MSGGGERGVRGGLLYEIAGKDCSKEGEKRDLL